MAKTRQIFPNLPSDAVGVVLPRPVFPQIVSDGDRYSDPSPPWCEANSWSLVICPSGTQIRAFRASNSYDQAVKVTYAGLWSVLSKKVWLWSDYYPEPDRTSIREVSDNFVTISCIPDSKSHQNPPQKVFLYTTTRGVVRIVEEVFKEWTDEKLVFTGKVRKSKEIEKLGLTCFGAKFPQSLYDLEDVAFPVYFDKLEESDASEHTKVFVKLLLSVFFGLCDPKPLSE